MNVIILLKFMLSKKATKIDEIFTIDLLFSKRQINNKDFANFSGLLRKYENTRINRLLLQWLIKVNPLIIWQWKYAFLIFIVFPFWYKKKYLLKLPWVYSVDQPPPPAGSYFIGPKASLAITWGGSKVLLGDYIFSFLHLTKESQLTSLTQTKVLRIRSNTFGDPLIQKI